MSKRGTLKHEARTLEHLLTHRYKNPYCNSCVRAKMKHHKTYRGAFRRKLTKFGDLITFDLIDSTARAIDTMILQEGFSL